MGLLASDTSALVLEDARVGADAVLGEVGSGFGIALAGLDGGRIGIAAQSIGIARAVARARDRVRPRAAAVRETDRRVRGDPLLRSRERATDLDAARMLALRAAWLRDRGRPFTREASMAKLFASEAAQRVTYQALQVFGGYGYMREYEVERYARDARATTIYEGTSEVQRMVIARSLRSPHDAPEEQDREAALARRVVRAGGEEARRTEGALHDALRSPDRAAVHGRRPGRVRSATRARRARRVPVHARHPADDVPLAPLDDAPVRGLRLRGGHQRALPLPARARRRPVSPPRSTCRR